METDREALAEDQIRFLVTDALTTYSPSAEIRDAAAARFDRWLAERDARIRREALDEAIAALSGFDCLADPVPSHVDVPDDYEAGIHDSGRILANLRDGGDGRG